MTTWHDRHDPKDYPRALRIGVELFLYAGIILTVLFFAGVLR